MNDTEPVARPWCSWTAIGRAVVHERRFDPAGVQSGASRFAFTIGSTASGATAAVRVPAGVTAPGAAREASPE